MAIIEITRRAKCKDCRYCQAFYRGKLKRHRCSNPLSSRYAIKYTEKTIRLNDLACEHWEL